jgi:hypothetical protein
MSEGLPESRVSELYKRSVGATGAKDLKTDPRRTVRKQQNGSGDVKRIALALGLTMFSLALVPSAQAKEAITRLKVCGASQCRTIADLRTLEILMMEIGDESVAPPARAPFYTMRPAKAREWPSTWPHYVYVPSSNTVWVTMDNGERYWDRLAFGDSLLRKATRDLKPNPAPKQWSAARIASMRLEGESNGGSPFRWFAGAGLALIVVSFVAQRARRLRRHQPPATAQGHQ